MHVRFSSAFKQISIHNQMYRVAYGTQILLVSKSQITDIILSILLSFSPMINFTCRGYIESLLPYFYFSTSLRHQFLHCLKFFSPYWNIGVTFSMHFTSTFSYLSFCAADFNIHKITKNVTSSSNCLAQL